MYLVFKQVLRHSGCDVSVICPKAKTYDTRSFEVIDGVKVYRYWQPWQGRGIFSYFAEYLWAMVFSFGLVCWIWVTDGFDVLHAANPPDLFCLVGFPFTLIGKRFVYDQHDLCPELLNSRLPAAACLRPVVRFCDWLSYKIATLVIVTNRSAYDVALARGASERQVCIVRNGPELDSSLEAESHPELKDVGKYLALYVGTIAPQDGVDRVVRAAHHIVYDRHRRDVTIAILGDGDSSKDVQALAHTLKVEPYIRLCGWLEGTEFFAYLSAADVCLAPEPPEEFNQLSSFIKLTDYMGYGKATVSFDLLESRRTLGASGVFVERDDPALFGDAILDILDDSVRQQELGSLAAARLRNNFYWGLSSKVLLDAYDNVIWSRLSS